MSSGLEDKVKQNTQRVIALEKDVGKLQVETSKFQLIVDHQEERQQERFNTLCTQQIEMKDIMKARALGKTRGASKSGQTKMDPVSAYASNVSHYSSDFSRVIRGKGN